MLDHFSHSELACPTTDQVRLSAGFGEALERLRVELGEPIYLNSACRSPQHNAKVRRHPRNLHLTVNDYWGTKGTCAVDAVATDGQYRAKLIRLALDQDRSVVSPRTSFTSNNSPVTAGCHRTSITMGDNL
jgi:hypothetical protein